MFKGITLVEMLVASLILVIGVTGSMQLYSINQRHELRQEQMYFAENQLRECLEKLKNNPDDLKKDSLWVPTAYKGQLKSVKDYIYNGFEGQKFRYTIELDTSMVRADSSNLEGVLARLKLIKSTIRWGKDSSMKMTTAINTGDYPQPAIAQP